MKLRFILFIFVVGLSEKSFSQITEVSVMDSAGKSIEYATVEVWKKNKAGFTDKNGKIDISLMNLSNEDSLIISAIGFKPQLIFCATLKDKIILEQQVKKLPEIFIYSGKWINENWGTQKIRRFIFNTYSCSWGLSGAGDQIGRVIKNLHPDKLAWIYKIAFYTQGAGDVRTPVRLRVYEINEKGPVNDLLTKTIVEKIDKHSGWLEFNLRDEDHIQLKDSLMIAAEYFDTSISNWTSYKAFFIKNNGSREKKIIKQYGGNFATDNETNQGDTWIRTKGNWRTNRFLKINDDCRNLVVQVWVKYPSK